MNTMKPTIDPYLFEKQFGAFKKFVEEQSKVSFVSFASNPYTEDEEGYKSEIYREARSKLVFQDWKESDIGRGDIIASTIESIEIQKNNLILWQSRRGDDNRPHQALYKARQDPEKIKAVEQRLFNLFHETDVEASFGGLIELFGQKYTIIAYLLFLKDRSKYLPIATTYFDNSFELLGSNFKTTKQCSWENYTQYLDLISQLKTMLSEALSTEASSFEVSMLDAHSFAWMLSSQMKEENLADVKEYLSLTDTERETIVKARKGQGPFRERLIKYWASCAVTGCQKHTLLIASHIKPWAKSDNTAERLDLYNGLLLSPNLDACFDSGFISFDDSGKILLSNELTEKDIHDLGINKDMKLSHIDPKHHKYLAYHRKNIFKKSL